MPQQPRATVCPDKGPVITPAACVCKHTRRCHSKLEAYEACARLCTSQAAHERTVGRSSASSAVDAGRAAGGHLSDAQGRAGQSEVTAQPPKQVQEATIADSRQSSSSFGPKGSCRQQHHQHTHLCTGIQASSGAQAITHTQADTHTHTQANTHANTHTRTRKISWLLDSCSVATIKRQRHQHNTPVEMRV